MTPADEREPSARPATGWQPTWAMRRVVVIFVVSAGMTLAFGRPAIALAVLPLGVGTALALAGRQGRPHPGLRVEMPSMAEVGGQAAAAISVSGLEAAEIVVLRLPPGIGPPG
ncbi:MAG TPA: hypothetical protein VFR13_07845, partial [Jiangellaceae bacterium]|nr:hypothetical protein [Jiangellaceae bacterium]